MEWYEAVALGLLAFGIAWRLESWRQRCDRLWLPLLCRCMAVGAALIGGSVRPLYET